MRILSFALALTVLFATACATTTTAGSPASSVTAPEVEIVVAPEPGRVVIKGDLVAIGESDALLPEAYPPTVAKTETSAGGCENGPGGIAVANATEFPLAITVDGEDLMILGPKTASQFVMPKTTVYLCLDPAKEHKIVGTALKAVLGTLYQLPITFDRKVEAGAKEPGKFLVNYRLLAECAKKPTP